MERLQGVWSMVSLEADGRAVPASALGGARIAIHGGHFTSTGMGAKYEGTVEVDATRTPKTINMKFTEGPEKGNTNYGIYELDANKLRIYFSTESNERPKEFPAKPTTGMILMVLERVSP